MADQRLIDRILHCQLKLRPETSRLIRAVREHLPQAVHRLTLPRADLIGMDLVARCDLLKRPVPRSASSATFALKSAVNLRRFVIADIPPKKAEYILRPCPVFRDQLKDSFFSSLLAVCRV